MVIEIFTALAASLTTIDANCGRCIFVSLLRRGGIGTECGTSNTFFRVADKTNTVVYKGTHVNFTPPVCFGRCMYSLGRTK